MARKKLELQSDLPSDQAQRERIKNAVNEIVDSMLKEAAEKDYRKGVFDLLKEDLGMSPKYIRKIAKLRFDEKYGEGNVKIDYEHSSQVIEDSDILFNQ